MDIFLIIGFSINIIGSILNVFGFVGLYFLKLPPFKRINPIRSDAFGGNEKNNIISIQGRLNLIFDELNKASKKNDKEANKFFLCVIFGFVFNIIGSTFMFVSSINFSDLSIF